MEKSQIMEKYIQISVEDLKRLITECVEKALLEHERNKVNVPARSHLTLKEAAQYLCISEQTLYQYVSEESITHIKKAKKLYFLIDDLNDWIKQSRYLSYEEQVIAHQNSMKK